MLIIKKLLINFFIIYNNNKIKNKEIKIEEYNKFLNILQLKQKIKDIF